VVTATASITTSAASVPQAVTAAASVPRVVTADGGRGPTTVPRESSSE
jgi:hypothetical protein